MVKTETAPVWGVVGLWLVLALVVGGIGGLAHAPVPPPAIALGLTFVCLLVLGVFPHVRVRVRALGVRVLVGFHVGRLLIGVYFLVRAYQGTLPAAFAVSAGWGDALVGILALVVLWRCLPIRTSGQRRAVLGWNVFGLLDILLVLFNGVRLFLQDPGLATSFFSLPMALLPLFIVPLVLVTHVVLFFWVDAPSETGGQQA